jgi:hypothetical protein
MDLKVMIMKKLYIHAIIVQRTNLRPSTPASYSGDACLKPRLRGFPWISLLSGTYREVPYIKSRPLSSMSFPIHYSLLNLSSDAMQS